MTTKTISILLDENDFIFIKDMATFSMRLSSLVSQNELDDLKLGICCDRIEKQGAILLTKFALAEASTTAHSMPNIRQ